MLLLRGQYEAEDKFVYFSLLCRFVICMIFRIFFLLDLIFSSKFNHYYKLEQLSKKNKLAHCFNWQANERFYFVFCSSVEKYFGKLEILLAAPPSQNYVTESGTITLKLNQNIAATKFMNYLPYQKLGASRFLTFKGFYCSF